MKKAVIVLGSPKANGNTSRLVEAMAAELDGVGDVSRIDLARAKMVNHCIACDGCKKSERRRCVFDDGLNVVIEEVRAADVLVIACPIYFFNLNSLTKAFIERLCYSSEISNSESLMRGKKIGLMVTYGLSDVIESGAQNALQSVYDMARFVGLEVIGIVHGPFGEDDEQNQLLLDRAKNLGRIVRRELLAAGVG